MIDLPPDMTTEERADFEVHNAVMVKCRKLLSQFMTTICNATRDKDSALTYTRGWHSALQEALAFTLSEVQALKQRIAELEQRSPMSYRGVWTPGKMHDRGDMVTHRGSVWHCDVKTDLPPGDGNTMWTLAVKRGRDGKDAGK